MFHSLPPVSTDSDSMGVLIVTVYASLITNAPHLLSVVIVTVYVSFSAPCLLSVVKVAACEY